MAVSGLHNMMNAWLTPLHSPTWWIEMVTNYVISALLLLLELVSPTIHHYETLSITVLLITIVSHIDDHYQSLLLLITIIINHGG